MAEHLSPDLKALVSRSVALLGEVICQELGPVQFRRIEGLRQRMADLRGVDGDRALKILQRSLGELERLPRRQRHDFAHAFTLMLEVMNTCENAYRTSRLRQTPALRAARPPEAIVFVLTAHPTEARTPALIAVFQAARIVLRHMLRDDFEPHETELRHLLNLAWRMRTTRRQKPSVRGEAEHIYSILLKDEILDVILQASSPVFVRTWVGGDKDGHPFVDRRAMLDSLNAARGQLLKYVRAHLAAAKTSLEWLGRKPQSLRALQKLEQQLTSLAKLRAGDGARVTRFRRDLQSALVLYEREIGATHPSFGRLCRLLEVFPSLVVPLELRESAEIVREAAAGQTTAIGGMLESLAVLSRGGDVRGYARGFILSMTCSSEDLEAGAKLVRRTLGDLRLPVTPLFEQLQDLRSSATIVDRFLASPSVRQAAKRYGAGRYEVMLGYSDSSKESGVLLSRVEIAEAMRHVDRVIKKRGLTPVFFHGSGGSIDRGGGSIQEQTDWWPPSALNLYKATVQGEMVERTFASPTLAKRQIELIASQASQGLRRKGTRSGDPHVLAFANATSRGYRTLVTRDDFGDLLSHATPYRYLSALKFGSRPTKRSAEPSLKGLRAIPWVLCWTQTRILMPTWWGLGSAWNALSASEQRRLRQCAKQPLFGSYTKALGFTLAKVEMPVWRLYLEETGLPRAQVDRLTREFQTEYAKAVKCARGLSGQQDLLWYRPWLGESVRLRSPMIHPLNLLQIIAMRTGDAELMRESVIGISAGMMTTG